MLIKIGRKMLSNIPYEGVPGLWSPFARNDHNMTRAGAVMEYRVGEWTYPKIEGTRIFVSIDISSVRMSLQSWPMWPTCDLVEYECEVLNPMAVVFRDAGLTSPLALSDYWRLHTSLRSYSCVLLSPDWRPIWTADAIRLTKMLRGV